MLSMICEQHRGSDISVTRVFPVPCPSMPLSRGIDVIVDELQACKINSGHLQYTAQQLDSISICASKALHHGDLPEVRNLLKQAINTMREAILILKLLCVMERARLPGYVLEHLILTREIIQQTMNEAIVALDEKTCGYSSTK
jgi:hypothetical protein